MPASRTPMKAVDMQQPTEFDPIKIFLSTFSISSFAGLAALLRTGRQLTVRGVLSAMLNSGLLGLGIAFIWYNWFAENLWFLMGVSLLAGLGGLTVLDFFLAVMRNGGLNLEVRMDKHGKEETDAEGEEDDDGEADDSSGRPVARHTHEPARTRSRRKELRDA